MYAVGPMVNAGRCRYRCDAFLILILLHICKYVSAPTYIGVVGSGKRTLPVLVLLGMATFGCDCGAEVLLRSTRFASLVGSLYAGRYAGESAASGRTMSKTRFQS
jgi:hypothetical protein